MKLGVCLEMFFTDRPLIERIGLAAKAGYMRQEIWLPEGRDPAELRAAASKAKAKIVSAVIGSPDGKLGGGLTRPGRRKEWLRRAEATFEFCGKAGISAAIVCTGNLVRGVSRAKIRRSVLDGLKATAERAEKARITLLLEPLNDKIDHPGCFLTSSDEGGDLCREVGSPRMKLLFDCYHVQIMEGDLLGHIRRNLDVIGHFHAAGHPGRHELWLGETNYPFVAKEIRRMGYKGVFAVEYWPTLDSAVSLRKTREYLGG